MTQLTNIEVQQVNLQVAKTLVEQGQVSAEAYDTMVKNIKAEA